MVVVNNQLAFSESVNDIISTLKENFASPEQLIGKYVRDLRKYPKIQFGNIELIIKFSNMLKNMSAFAKYSCSQYRLCDATLLGECVAKLPYELQVQWAEYKENIKGYANIADFSRFVSVTAQQANTLRETAPKIFEAKSLNTKAHAKGFTFAANIQASKSCPICNSTCEKVANCLKFKSMSIDDRWLNVKELRLCFTCLKVGHSMVKCYSKQRCQVDDCTKRHHKLLHRNVNHEVEKGPAAAAVFNAEVLINNHAVWFQIVPVRVAIDAKVISTYAFIDHGASHSMIEKSLAEKLALEVETETLDMQWLKNIRVTYPARKVSFNICGLADGCKWSKMSNVYAVKDMYLPKQSVPVRKNIASVGSKRLITLNYVDAKPEIMLDYVSLTVPLEKPLVINEQGAVAACTTLGDVVYGPSGEGTHRAFFGCSFVKRHDPIESMMTEYFANDNFGVIPAPNGDTSEREKKRLEKMNENTKYESGTHVVRLLWKNENVKFAASYEVAAKRLNGVVQKINHDAEFANIYKAIIDDFLKKGYVRKLTDIQANEQQAKTLYLPHFAVRNPNKAKIRVVFDAAAEMDGYSMNNQLFAGPDFTTPLLNVLFKFRHGQVALCADIREMFLQVCINQEDQNCQRFLWLDENKNVKVYVVTRMMFVRNAVVCIGIILKYKIN